MLSILMSMSKNYSLHKMFKNYYNAFFQKSDLICLQRTALMVLKAKSLLPEHPPTTSLTLHLKLVQKVSTFCLSYVFQNIFVRLLKTLEHLRSLKKLFPWRITSKVNVVLQVKSMCTLKMFPAVANTSSEVQHIYRVILSTVVFSQCFKHFWS